MNDKKLLRRALDHHKRGAFTEALRLYSELFDRHPHDSIGDDCAYFGGLAAYQCRSIAPADFPVSWAIKLLELAVQRRPKAAEIWVNLGHVHQEAGHADKARSCYERALHLDEGRLAARGQLGNVFLDLGAPMRARWNWELARDLTPQTDDDHYYRGLACLTMGDYAEGFREYEYRWSLVEWLNEKRADVVEAGGTLVHCEQGVGDNLMVLRWLPRFTDRWGPLTLEAPPGMGRFLSGQFPGVEVVEFGQPLPPVRRWIASMSLPHLFQVQQPSDIPQGPYLRAGAFRPLPGAFKVGMVWAGSAKLKNDARRSTQIHDWAPLLELPGVTWHSLQVGERAGECPAGVVDLTAELHDWADTAGALAQLDLLISVDSGAAHLAGALGIPTWLLLASAPDWRWLAEGAATPWYPSHVLFRQWRGMEWGPVFQQVREALINLTAERTAA